MAKTENLLQGRLGNLIFYKVKGVTRIRSVPLMVHNPETPAQQAVRKRLIAAVQFYRRLKDTPLKAVWQVAARDTPVNGYNLFLKRNIHAFNDRTLGMPSALSMTCGSLPRMNDLRMAGRSDRTVTLAWNNSLEAEDRTAGDWLQVVALFERRMYSPVWLKEVQAWATRKRRLTWNRRVFTRSICIVFSVRPMAERFPIPPTYVFPEFNHKIVIIMKWILETVAGVVERLSLSSAEKKRLKQELEAVLLENERQRVEMQARVVGEETRGNWLQRSWRPVLMLVFAVVILAGMFTDLPMLADTSRFWDLLEIGLGGYIVGRFRMRK